ncbi:barstar family protein [Streptomyces sp. 142MFCol3.1]|uniref:barstar family protein n=1 Tax=Streptomyces sp. 142MFCol3.1 TaxID=1172179 RepID=UPI0004046097|nr:barstar family protein [Streptomyces sp. 142MFCol3.1]
MTRGPLAEVCHAAGWQVTVLDLTGITDKAGFMARCVRALDLPDWFGRNWDALADVLGDPDWGPASPGRLLVVTGWRRYAKARPDEWEVAQQVLESAAGHYERFDAALSVVLSLGGSDELLPDQPG